MFGRFLILILFFLNGALIGLNYNYSSNLHIYTKITNANNTATTILNQETNRPMLIEDYSLNTSSKIISNNNTTPTKEDYIKNKNTKNKLLVPNQGLYFGAFADFGPHEDNIEVSIINNFHNMVGKKIAWAYFSDNWFNDISFPTSSVETLKSLNITPFIRIMPRIDFDNRGQDSPYTLNKIQRGDFDSEIRQWAKDAIRSNTPLIIEFGTEVNGDWFPWNGRWNIINNDTNSGSKTFIDAYRHIIDLFNEEGVNNVTWVYHVNAISSPNTYWNEIMDYYPGDNYIDWIGVSVYGAQNKNQDWISFDEVYSPAYHQITAVTDKPIAIVEFGVSEGTNYEDKSLWLNSMFTSLQKNLYPNTKGISYWHSHWIEDDGTVSNLRLDSSTKTRNNFSKLILNNYYLSNTQFSH